MCPVRPVPLRAPIVWATPRLGRRFRSQRLELIERRIAALQARVLYDPAADAWPSTDLGVAYAFGDEVGEGQGTGEGDYGGGAVD